MPETQKLVVQCLSLLVPTNKAPAISHDLNQHKGLQQQTYPTISMHCHLPRGSIACRSWPGHCCWVLSWAMQALQLRSPVGLCGGPRDGGRVIGTWDGGVCECVPWREVQWRVSLNLFLIRKLRVFTSWIWLKQRGTTSWVRLTSRRDNNVSCNRVSHQVAFSNETSKVPPKNWWKDTRWWILNP